MSTERIECSNEKCQCFVTAILDPKFSEPTEAYCSGDCREAATGEEGEMCGCGHPACDTP